MGGHGGLNILPQKSWNVYGQKNRQKVAEDEAERDKKEARVQAQHDKATRELRLRALRVSLPDAHPDIDVSRSQEAEQAAASGSTAAHQGHINFWEDLERTTANRAAQEEAKKIARVRGDPKTQTSDARFDERFAVMHGLAGKVPWYAEADLQRVQRPSDVHEGYDRTKPSGKHHASHKRNSFPRGGKRKHGSDKRESLSPSPSRRHKHEKKARKHKHKKQHKDDRRGSDSDVSPAPPQRHTRAAGQHRERSMAELRAERLQREEAEAARSKALLQRHYQ